MAQVTISYKLPRSEAPRLRAILAASGWRFDDRPYMEWQARDAIGVVSFYTSGSCVLQTTQPDILTEMLELDDAHIKSDSRGNAPAPPPSKATSSSTAPSRNTPPSTGSALQGAAAGRLATYEAWRSSFGEPLVYRWIGIDEAGKGDFFGPLITAAVRVEAKDLGWLAELGVGDSKQINDRNIRPLAARLKKALPYNVVKLMPETYNRLYTQFGNLNRLLAWTHAAAAEAVLENADAELILSDQFTKQAIVPGFFKGPGKACRYVQQTKAESDAAVGCASILARAELLWSMDALADEYGLRLNKGAGSPTIADARRFMERHGVDALPKVAKTHFKTMETIGAR